MKFLLVLGLQFTILRVTSLQNLIAPTYNKSCTSSRDCLEYEMCLEDFCNQSRCLCDVTHFYNNSLNSCEIKKQYQSEECEDCDQCSTWFSVCDTTTSHVKPVCTCRTGYIYDSATDSCTNVEPCPEDGSYIFSRVENVCYKVSIDCTDCTSWDDVCTENNSVPLNFVGNLQQHFIDRMWSYSFYSYQRALEASLTDEVVIIILSTTFNYTLDKREDPVWYWPDGGEITLKDDIDYSNWTRAAEEEESCLYMLYDACEPIFKASTQCRFEKAYRGCFIQLPHTSCYTDVDGRNTTWAFTEAGTVLTKPCPTGYTGDVTRECTTSGDFKLPFYNCTLVILKNLGDQLESGNISTSEALSEVSSGIKETEDLFIGDLLEVQNIMEKIVDLSANTTISENSTDDFLETASLLIDHEKNGKEWESRVENEGKGAEEFLSVVEKFVKQATESLIENNVSSISLAKPNIVLEYASVDTNTSTPSHQISFPAAQRDSPDWNNTATSSLRLDFKSFLSKGVKAYTCLLYRNLSKSVPQTLKGKSNTTKLDINSQVVSLQLLPKAPSTLDPELELQFQGFQDMKSTEQHCSFWDSDSSGKAFWSTDGCRRVAGNDTVVTCKCNHLTNFALLISPYVPPEKDSKALGIITIVTTTISGVLILLTLCIHIRYWRLMKSDKTILVVCLCVTFLVCYALFLGGVTQTSNKTACTAIAVVLHYVFLALFFLMLAEGVNIFITVTFPFYKKSHIRELIVGAFVLPLVITAISAGVTKLDGYGNENSCWLTPWTGLFWAFAGPAAVIILANIITVVLFFRRLFGTKSASSKSIKEKAKMTAIALGVLTPVMGFTWVFGLFSVNRETLWLQYLFCVFNGLQGVLIFLFHCVGNKQLRRVIKVSRERKKTVEEFQSEMKEKMKSRFATHTTETTDTSTSTTTKHDYSETEAETSTFETRQTPSLKTAGDTKPVQHGEEVDFAEENKDYSSKWGAQHSEPAFRFNPLFKRIQKLFSKNDKYVISELPKLAENAVGKTDDSAIVKTDVTALGKSDDNAIGQTDDNAIGKSDDNDIGKTDDNGIGKTDDNAMWDTYDNGFGNTDDNGFGNTDDNDIGKSVDNATWKTDSNDIGKSDENAFGKTDDNVIWKTDGNGIGQTDDNGIGQTDDNAIGKTDDNDIGKSDDNAFGKTNDKGIWKTDDYAFGKTDDNISKTDDNDIWRTDDYGIGKTDDNDIGKTDDNANGNTDYNDTDSEKSVSQWSDSATIVSSAAKTVPDAIGADDGDREYPDQVSESNSDYTITPSNCNTSRGDDADSGKLIGHYFDNVEESAYSAKGNQPFETEVLHHRLDEPLCQDHNVTDDAKIPQKDPLKPETGTNSSCLSKFDSTDDFISTQDCDGMDDQLTTILNNSDDTKISKPEDGRNDRIENLNLTDDNLSVNTQIEGDSN